MTGLQSGAIRVPRLATRVLLWLAAACCTVPALASTTSPEMCPDGISAKFGIAADALDAVEVSNSVESDGVTATDANVAASPLSPTRYFSPSTGATLSTVLKEAEARDSDESDAETPLADGERQAEMKARVPGVSDADLARYKRQMYRRDI